MLSPAPLSDAVAVMPTPMPTPFVGMRLRQCLRRMVQVAEVEMLWMKMATRKQQVQSTQQGVCDRRAWMRCESRG